MLQENEIDNEIIESLKQSKVFIYGTGTAGQFLFDQLSNNRCDVVGFLQSEPTNGQNQIKKMPVWEIENADIPPGSVIIIASMYWKDILHFMPSFADVRILKYFHYVCEPEKLFTPGRDLSENAETLKAILCDEKSLQVVDSVIAYQASLGNDRLAQIKENDQYFPDFIKTDDYRIFVDVGSFNGDTLDALQKRDIPFEKAICFEPDPHNQEAFLSKYDNDQRVELIGKAVGSKLGNVCFSSSEHGFSSKVSATGSTEVELTTLDAEIKAYGVRPSIIKIDVEGEDLNVLKGGMSTIARFRPILMVSIYHSPQHLFEIPKWLNNELTQYSLFIRHYRNDVFETICYAIPDEKLDP